MERIHKVDQRLASTGYGLSATVFGLPFIAVGNYFALAGFEVIALPGRANAPLWVIGVIDVVFAGAGLWLALAGLGGAWRKRANRRRAHTHPQKP